MKQSLAVREAPPHHPEQGTWQLMGDIDTHQKDYTIVQRNLWES